MHGSEGAGTQQCVPATRLIVGKGQGSAIGTLVDRASRYVRLIHLPGGWKAPQVRDALVAQTADWPVSLRRTLTWDQGRELYHHQEIDHPSYETPHSS
ncbi:hypothetical protein [Streptomyces sp. V4I8]|uniref:hypothetical protein n=1 Tax=Streptomyces sp. V4I8 TaxID=3156469 RepID=UPI003512BFE6